MPITPSLYEGRLIGVRRPGAAFLHDFLAAWGFRLITLGFKLGVLEMLAKESAEAADVAARLGLDPKGTRFLLDSLACLGYLRRRGELYEATRMARELLPMVATGMPYFEKLLTDDWSDVEGRLRREGGLPFEIDAPRTTRWFARDRRVFQNGMVALANLNIAEVLRRIRVSAEPGHVCDVGGGHGLYAVALCARHPQLTGTVFDVPEMRPNTMETITAHGLADRVSFRAGDFLSEDLGSCSIALCFNIINSKSREQIRLLLDRVVSALTPGGQVVLLDKFASERLGGIGRAFGSFMSVNMFSAVGQQTYGLEEVRAWFREAGLSAVKSRPVRSSPGNALVMGRKRG